MSCGADTAANTLLTSLLGDKLFEVPSVDLTGPEFQIPSETGDLFGTINRLTNADLTTGVVGGAGTFDVLMKSAAAHLRAEYEATRITGGEYTKAYIALMENAMSNAVNFLVNQEQAYWQAVAAQLQSQIAKTQVVTARVELEATKAKLATARYEAYNGEALYGLTKLKMAGEDMAYCTAKFTFEEILPEQKKLVTEQAEAARAQTLETRTDGSPVEGMLGKQKALYSQQIDSYKRDSETKLIKIFADAWITQKTMDEGTLPPDAFNNANLNSLLNQFKVLNGFT